MDGGYYVGNKMQSMPDILAIILTFFSISGSTKSSIIGNALETTIIVIKSSSVKLLYFHTMFGILRFIKVEIDSSNCVLKQD